MPQERARLPHQPPSWPRVRWIALALALVAAAAFFVLESREIGSRARPPGSTDHHGPNDRTVFAAYAGSASCRECHVAEFDLWKNSHHALAERPWIPVLDRPAFDPPRTIRHGTQTSEVEFVARTSHEPAFGRATASGRAAGGLDFSAPGRRRPAWFMAPFQAPSRNGASNEPAPLTLSLSRGERVKPAIIAEQASVSPALSAGRRLLSTPQNELQDGERFSLSHPMGEGRGEGSPRFRALMVAQRQTRDSQNPTLVTLGPDGARRAFLISRVIGVDPLRQFLVSTALGRIQVTELAFDPRRGEWFDVFGNEDRKAGEWGHWTGRGMTWNAMCATCHNTRVRKNYNAATDTYSTAMAEVGVGCEACHGPMAAHVAWQQKHSTSASHEANPLTLSLSPGERGIEASASGPFDLSGAISVLLGSVRKGQHTPSDGDPFSLSHPMGEGRGEGSSRLLIATGAPERKTPSPDPTLHPISRDQMLDACGSCHARRAELTGDFVPGDRFFDHYSLVIPDDTDVFYADGQVRGEDYEFTSFLSSRMYAAGVRCADCHEPHSGKTRAAGSALCLRCHQGQMPTAPKIDPAAHGHHALGKPGSGCVDCHMPTTVYMQRHARHDHGFTIPDPLLTRELGIPNACNRCHTDRDAAWTLAAVENWFGAKMDRPTRTRARTVAQARAGVEKADQALLRMLQTEKIGLWRAVAANLLRRWLPQTNVTTALFESANDANPLVRAMAARALEPLAHAAVPAAQLSLRRLLGDPVRAVRIEAAWTLHSTLDTNTTAGADLARFLAANLDEPSGAMQMGVFDLDRGDNASALAWFRRAAAWDGGSAPLRQALAVSLSLSGDTAGAVHELEAACSLAPRDPEYRFKLGLALNEVGRLNDAVAALEQAVKLDPRYPQAWYNLGLAYSAQDQPDRALDALVRAESIDPRSPQIPYARATVLARLGRAAEARAAAQRALELQPDFPAAADLVRTLAARPQPGN